MSGISGMAVSVSSFFADREPCQLLRLGACKEHVCVSRAGCILLEVALVGGGSPHGHSSASCGPAALCIIPLEKLHRVPCRMPPS